MKPFMMLNDGQTRRDHKETLKGRIEAFTNTCHDPETGEFCETSGPGGSKTGPKAGNYDEYGRHVTQSGKVHGRTKLRPPIVLGNLAHIPLSDDEHGPKATIDAADVELVSKYGWNHHKDGYAYAKVYGKNVSMQKLLTGETNLDHINRDKLDNRRANLRPATKSQNEANTPMRRNNTIGLKGVTRDGKRFKAQIQGKNLGRFDTPEEAHEAYKKAAKEIYGEYADN